MIPDPLIKLSHSNPILLYDGVCIMCCGFVKYFIEKDTKEVLRYASLQSAIPSDKELHTVYLIHNGVVLEKSDVSVHLAKLIELPWYFSALKFIPRFIRNFGYDIIARIRYRILGKRDSCMNILGDKGHLFLN